MRLQTFLDSVHLNMPTAKKLNALTLAVDRCKEENSCYACLAHVIFVTSTIESRSTAAPLDADAVVAYGS